MTDDKPPTTDPTLVDRTQQEGALFKADPMIRALIDIGNQHYRSRRIEKAREAYARAQGRVPKEMPLFNDLFYTLLNLEDELASQRHFFRRFVAKVLNPITTLILGLGIGGVSTYKVTSEVMSIRHEVEYNSQHINNQKYEECAELYFHGDYHAASQVGTALLHTLGYFDYPADFYKYPLPEFTQNVELLTQRAQRESQHARALTLQEQGLEYLIENKLPEAEDALTQSIRLLVPSPEVAEVFEARSVVYSWQDDAASAVTDVTLARYFREKKSLFATTLDNLISQNSLPSATESLPKIPEKKSKNIVPMLISSSGGYISEDITVRGDPFNDFVLDPQGRYVAYLLEPGEVLRLIDIQQHETYGFHSHNVRFSALAFSSHSDRIALTAIEDQKSSIWEIDLEKCIATSFASHHVATAVVHKVTSRSDVLQVQYQFLELPPQWGHSRSQASDGTFIYENSNGVTIMHGKKASSYPLLHHAILTDRGDQMIYQKKNSKTGYWDIYLGSFLPNGLITNIIIASSPFISPPSLHPHDSLPSSFSHDSFITLDGSKVFFEARMGKNRNRDIVYYNVKDGTRINITQTPDIDESKPYPNRDGSVVAYIVNLPGSPYAELRLARRTAP